MNAATTGRDELLPRERSQRSNRHDFAWRERFLGIDFALLGVVPTFFPTSVVRLNRPLVVCAYIEEAP